MMGEGTAKLASMVGRGEIEAPYLAVRYEDIISHRRKKELRAGEPTDSIRRKLREEGEGS